MKLNFKIASIYVLLPLLMSACSSSLDEEISDEHPTAFTLSVCVSSYASNQGRQTRSVGTAYPFTFRKDDQLGIIAFQNNQIVVNYNNIPFTYQDGKWVPATALPFSSAYTYLVYYPYQAAMTGKTTKNDIIASFNPPADQRNEATYRASDLLVCDLITPKATDKTLNVTFEHAFSLLVIPPVKATITSEETTYQCGLPFTDASITAGTAVGLPYVASDGTARLVVKPQTAAFKSHFNYNGKLYSSSSTSQVALSANYCYAFKELTATAFTYNFDKMQEGDFYCTTTTTSGTTGYLVPYNAVSFPNGMNCIGLVFKKDKETSDDGNYEDVNGNAISTFHGYVVALQDVGAFAWANKGGAYDFSVGTSTSETDWKGYSNCQKMKGTGGNWNITYFPAANACITFGTAGPSPQYAAPTGSSGWFLPSCGQLSSLYNSRDLLSGQINKLKTISNYEATNWFLATYYWSSSEDQGNSGNARRVYFGFYVYNGSKNDDYPVRSILAF